MRWLASWALFVVLGCDPEGLDDVSWACATSADCGPSARCSDGLCRRLAPGESASSCPIDLPPGRVSVELDRTAEGQVLAVRFAGRRATFRLPDGVKALSLPACCEHFCCSGAE